MEDVVRFLLNPRCVREEGIGRTCYPRAIGPGHNADEHQLAG